MKKQTNIFVTLTHFLIKQQQIPRSLNRYTSTQAYDGDGRSKDKVRAAHASSFVNSFHCVFNSRNISHISFISW